jgi:uncharacterized membrane protein
MWGPGPWMGPMGGFGWIFPVMGLLVCLFFLIVMARMMGRDGPFACMGPRHHDGDETAQLRREVEELRAEVRKQAAR